MSVRSLRYNTIDQHFTKSALASTDRDALAFLEAAQIYNTNQQRAIVNLVRSLKRTGLWTKMKAIYPFVGGTASSHKWNLKDPRDLDAAFRLTFSGGWTHSSTGADPNGTNAYADTFFVPVNNSQIGSVSYGIYNRENSTVGVNDCGVGIAAGNSAHMAILSRLSNTFYGDCWNNGANRIQVSSFTDRRGFIFMSRTSTTSIKAFRNGSQIGTTNTSTATSTFFNALTGKFILAAFNQGAPVLNAINFTDVQQAFAFIGDGLTDAESSTFYNIVDLYQKRLGRAV